MSTISPILKKILLFLVNLLDDDPNIYYLLIFGIPIGVITLIITICIIVKEKENRLIGFTTLISAKPPLL